jgi:glycosyltransferase involved in cell wall biosynthesis
MDFSVIVPFYNAEPTIERCLRALLEQNYPQDRYEILMIDNNSTDRSAAIVQRYPRIRYLKERKQGSYAARNRGIAAASGAIVAFTDPDCVPRADWLEQIMSAMQIRGTRIVLGDRRFAADTPIVSLLAAYESEMAAQVFSSNDIDAYYGYTNNMAVRKTLLDELGCFMELKRGADNIFVRRAIQTHSCDIVRYASEVSIRHLEIETVSDYLIKKWTYGRVNRANRALGSPSGLSRSSRLELFKRAIRRENHGLPVAALFFVFLAMGALCFELGRKA